MMMSRRSSLWRAIFIMLNRMRVLKNNQQTGFTLLEILIALFIFTILSLILSAALRNVIDVSAGTARSAERLRTTQIAMLMMSRDIEQAVNRPVLDANGKEESAFIGKPISFTLTRTGFANPTGVALQSSLQRIGYYWSEESLWRNTWPVLDRAPASRAHARRLLTDVTAVSFQYLDKDGHFHNEWPAEGQSKEPLPRAIRINLTISQWGKLSQLYVIPVQPSKTVPGSSPAKTS